MHILTEMDASQIIEKLKERGWSEYAIAKRTKERGTPISQSTVNRIATGETENPSYETFRALESLLVDSSKSRPSRRAPSALIA
jgi:transcriptional regulator with XRE-family HTH domain